MPGICPNSGRDVTSLAQHGDSTLVARIKTGCEKKGRPITFTDAWIAAAALQLGVPLGTHNASGYGAVENLTILTARAR